MVVLVFPITRKIMHNKVLTIREVTRQIIMKIMETLCPLVRILLIKDTGIINRKSVIRIENYSPNMNFKKLFHSLKLKKKFIFCQNLFHQYFCQYFVSFKIVNLKFSFFYNFKIVLFLIF